MTLQEIAAILLRTGGFEKGRFREIYEALAESFAIMQKLGLPDGVAVVGLLLAQVMAIGGLRDEALAVLGESEPAFRKLGRADGVAHVRQLRDRIAQRPPSSRQEPSP